MREIFIRGKREDTGEWVYGWYVQKQNPHSLDGLPIKHYITDLPPFGYIVDPETVGQFTGLQDKYDRKIYEGDILGAHLFEDEPDYETRVVVEWHEAGWYAVQRYSDLKPCYDPLHEALDGNRFEIIGNIHDNPELIRGEEKSDA